MKNHQPYDYNDNISCSYSLWITPFYCFQDNINDEAIENMDLTQSIAIYTQGETIRLQVSEIEH
jgi:hypothetical protein